MRNGQGIQPSIRRTFYSDRQKTDTASIAAAMLQRPDKISQVLTFLGGMEDDQFRMTLLTEGMGNTVSVNNFDYEYDVQYPPKETRELAATNSGSNLGRGAQPFTLTFPDRWFIYPYVLVSESGAQVRIMQEPTPNGSNWDYLVQLINPDKNAAFPAADAVAGKRFVQLFAPVGLDWSRGNASNFYAPSKIRHKLTTIRKSYHVSGNANGQVVEVSLPKKGGGTTKLWMEHEEWQRYLQWKKEMETLYLYAERNYDEAGNTTMFDENGQPIFISPGLFQQVVNKDYRSILTARKIKEVVRNIFADMRGAQKKEITLYTGLGGKEDFDTAMKQEMSGFNIVSTDKFVKGEGRALALTGFFTTYEHIDGYTVKVVHHSMFDHGTYAENKPRHPISGLSLESHRMLFLDTSTYDGQSNLAMVQKKGRELLRWAVAGSTIPYGFSGNDLRASDIDGASVHYLKVGGLLLRNWMTSFDLQVIT